MCIARIVDYCECELHHCHVVLRHTPVVGDSMLKMQQPMSILHTAIMLCEGSTYLVDTYHISQQNFMQSLLVAFSGSNFYVKVIDYIVYTATIALTSH